MVVKRRWMRNMLAESAVVKVRLPWERGLRREASIARRKDKSQEPMRRRA